MQAVGFEARVPSNFIASGLMHGAPQAPSERTCDLGAFSQEIALELQNRDDCDR